MCLSFLYRIGGSQRISLEGPSIDFLGVWLAQLGQATSIWNYITHATVGGGHRNAEKGRPQLWPAALAQSHLLESD